MFGCAPAPFSTRQLSSVSPADWHPSDCATSSQAGHPPYAGSTLGPLHAYIIIQISHPAVSLERRRKYQKVFMKEYGPQESATPDVPARRHHRLPWLLAGGCLLAILAALLLPPVPESSSSRDSTQTNDVMAARTRSAKETGVSLRRGTSELGPTSEEIVSRKLNQFGKSRRDLVHALSKHFKVEVPDDVERFFDAVEGGRWEEIDAAHKSLLLGGDLTTPRSAELHQIWRAIQEMWGVAREAHDWPAQKLLDYGEAVLGSLRPGMIYVGGTDPGCFIPTFLNETSENERHVVL